MPANTAMSRLHRILAHRKGMLFVFKPVSQTFDLRKATNRFRITQVDFEVLPVNPHTGDLGQQLGESKKLDHIQKLKGKAEAKPNDALKLAGGFLTAIQELQQSGHCRVASLEVQVNKPRRPRELSEDPEEETWGDEADVRVVLRGRRLEYPFLRITSWRCFNSQEVCRFRCRPSVIHRRRASRKRLLVRSPYLRESVLWQFSRRLRWSGAFSALHQFRFRARCKG